MPSLSIYFRFPFPWTPTFSIFKTSALHSFNSSNALHEMLCAISPGRILKSLRCSEHAFFIFYFSYHSGPYSFQFYGEYSETGCSEQEFTNLGFEESEVSFPTSSLADKIPFLQMLRSVESQSFKEPNFQNLLKQQHLNKPWEEGVGKIQELVELFSSPINSETKDRTQLPNSDGVSSECNQNPGLCRTQMAKAPVTKERRKRKRSKSTKNKEEVESQRMTHITVERNRRRQMNDHLNVIKSLIPTSYIQRGDQASIIGGAIDFVKELEQLLESLEARKKERKGAERCKGEQSEVVMASNGRIGEGVCAELKSAVAEIEVTMIQTHVNLKIKCPKRQGQLLKAIVALEDLRLTVLHLNITTSQATATMLYSFNLKIEDDCKLGSAEQIAATVNQIFSFINDGRVVNEGTANNRRYSGSR